MGAARPFKGCHGPGAIAEADWKAVVAGTHALSQSDSTCHSQKQVCKVGGTVLCISFSRRSMPSHTSQAGLDQLFIVLGWRGQPELKQTWTPPCWRSQAQGHQYQVRPPHPSLLLKLPGEIISIWNADLSGKRKCMIFFLLKDCEKW